jgi:hypothetical protein
MIISTKNAELCTMPAAKIEAAARAFAAALIAGGLLEHVRRIVARVHADPYDGPARALTDGLGTCLPFDHERDLVFTGVRHAASSLEIDALDRSGNLLFRQAYVPSANV